MLDSYQERAADHLEVLAGHAQTAVEDQLQES